MKKYILILILVFFSKLIFAQEKWFVNNPKGFDFYLTTTIENGTITGMTRKDALIDFVGRFKFTLAKMTTSIIYPEIVHFEGSIKGSNFTGKYQMIFDQLNFSGIIKNDSLKIMLTNDKNKTIKLIGAKVDKIEPIRNYNKTVNAIIKLTESNVDNQKFVKSEDWLKFKIKMVEVSDKILDDLGLEIAFGAIAKNLPNELIDIVKDNTKILLDLE